MPIKISKSKLTPRDIIVKFSKYRDIEKKILEQQDKRYPKLQGKTSKFGAGLSTEIW